MTDTKELIEQAQPEPSKYGSPELQALILAKLQQASVPEGWKLVPVEATPEMISAGAVHHYGACSRQDRSDADKAWDAMLAAAPQPKEKQ